MRKNIMYGRSEQFIKFGTASFWRWLLSAATVCFWGGGIAFADTIYVNPGDLGTIKFQIESSTESADVAAGVQTTVEAPTQFIVKDTSIRGPSDIAIGQTNTFVIDYEIAADATDGPFKVLLKVGMPVENVDPALKTLETSVDFIGNYLISVVV